MPKNESVTFGQWIMALISFIYDKIVEKKQTKKNQVPQLKDDLTVTFAWIC